MTAPIDYGMDILDRAQGIVDLVGTAVPEPNNIDADLLRSAWAFTGASIDTYFHERVRRNILSGGLSNKGKKFVVPLAAVDSIIDDVVHNRETATRPRVRLKEAIQDELGYSTFQGHRNVEYAFALIGVTGYWAAISTALGPTTVEKVKNRLDRQYRRRNRISHEGDLIRQQRPQKLKYCPIRRSEVQHEIDWTRDFLIASDSCD